MYANPSSVGVSLYFAFSRFPQQFLEHLAAPAAATAVRRGLLAGLVLGKYLPSVRLKSRLGERCRQRRAMFAGRSFILDM